MEIQPLSKSAFVVAMRSGVRLLYSFGAPVAVFVPGRGYLRSEWYVSRSTTAHVREFCAHAPLVLPHDQILKIAQEA